VYRLKIDEIFLIKANSEDEAGEMAREMISENLFSYADAIEIDSIIFEGDEKI
jgi:hypothetical protein